MNHKGLNTSDFWAPPGGGLEFGEPAAQALEREFLEETGLTVRTGAFRFGCEFIQPPLHAVELFFDVAPLAGTLQTGHDPEIQIVQDAAFMTLDEIAAKPATSIHGIFQHARTETVLRNLQGFYRI